MQHGTNSKAMYRVPNIGEPAVAFEDIEPMESTNISSPGVEAEALRQKTALLYRNAGAAFAVNIINGTLLAYVSATFQTNFTVTIVWWIATIGIATARYLLARKFQSIAVDANASELWRVRYIAATTLAAIAWGSGSVLLMWDAPDSARLFTGLVLGGMVAGAVPLLAPVPAAFNIFASFVIAPFAASIFLLASSPLDWAFGSMTLVFYAAMVSSARYLHETINSAIKLGIEKSQIVANLESLSEATKAALSGRIQALADLQVSEERHRQILQHSPTGIVHYDKELCIEFCNERFSEIVRAPMQALIGLDMHNLKDQRIMGALGAPIEGHIGKYEGEYIATFSGLQVWVSMTCTPIAGMHGSKDGGIAFIDDISDRKKIEIVLQESEQKLRAIADNVKTVMFLKDLSGRYLYVNRQYEKLFHVTNALMDGKTDYDIFPKNLADAFVANDLAVVKTEQSIEVEEQVLQDDVLHTYISVKLPIRNADDEIYAVCGIATDITERKLAEADLRIAASAFESQESMMITDAQTRILRVNQAFTQSTGFTAEEAVGKTPRILKSGRHDAEFYRKMWDTIHATGGWQGEIWDRRKNGEIYPKWLTISSVKGEDGVVTNYISTHHDITERKLAEEKIAELAFFDPLTRLPNRTLLMDRLRQTMTGGGRTGTLGALLFIDLDQFKTLNDTLGHDTGDLLLQQVAVRLNGCVRSGDTVARLGGDEFVVVLENLGESTDDAATHTKALGEKILVALGQPYQLGFVEHRITASIGATLFLGQQVTVDELLKQADLAMYKAKETGRNALRFFDPAMQIIVLERASLEKNLRLALHEHQFVLHYQAQIEGDCKRVIGAEALLRWVHPDLGLMPPNYFIPLAEDTGLILPIGLWVLETACVQLARWTNNPFLAHLNLAVNISANQLHEPDFVDQVMSVLSRTGANPKKLKLELTESLLVTDIESVIAKMASLKALGVGFSLDDFGTGYSSLSYLKRLRLDQLKIDRSFVENILTDANDAAIAKMVIALAESLNLSVIAEGVEVDAQRAFLADLGCNLYQGYLFSRPLPLEAFEVFVTRSVISST
jgi:diguanylate cyclase (GGDEF)-like protein/PAS domain S-box-containing protein